jgi:hypothetical protein
MCNINGTVPKAQMCNINGTEVVVLDAKDEKYLYRSLNVADLFDYFYIMAKVHTKKPRWKLCPIASVSRSITHKLGRWLDQQLKPIIQKLPSYITSFFQLKQQLE